MMTFRSRSLFLVQDSTALNDKSVDALVLSDPSGGGKTHNLITAVAKSFHPIRNSTTSSPCVTNLVGVCYMNSAHPGCWRQYGTT